MKRGILRRSTVGLIATRRDPSGTGESNVAAGLDASLGFFDSLDVSGYYARTKKEASYGGYVGLNSHLAFEPSVSLAWVDLPYGQFNARVLSARTIVTPNARMMLSGLMQFNAATHSLSSSARLRWEYRPGSELFVVYSDGRDTLTGGVPDIVNRSFAIKLTRLLRY